MEVHVGDKFGCITIIADETKARIAQYEKDKQAFIDGTYEAKHSEASKAANCVFSMSSRPTDTSSFDWKIMREKKGSIVL